MIGIFFIALGLRLWGITFGLPYTYASDEPTYLTIALQILRLGDLNPHWWFYPSLMHYLNAGALLLYFVVGRLMGAFSSPMDLTLPEVVTMGVGHLTLPAEYVITRGLVALVSAASVFVVYRIGRVVHPGRWTAILAAFLFAISPTVISTSHRLGPDIFALFFSLVSLYFAVQIVQDPRLANYLLAGGAAGFAIGSKYNTGIVLVAIVAAHCRQYGFSGWRRKELLAGLAASAIAFLIVTPFALLDWPGFSEGVRFQVFSYSSEGHAGQEGNALAWYVTYLWQSEGLIAALALIAGLRSLFDKSKALVLASFTLTYFIFVSFLYVRNERTIMQIIPCLDLLAALLIVQASEWLLRTKGQGKISLAAAVIVTSLVAVVPLHVAVGADYQLANQDDREAARIWIDQNLPLGARVAVEAYSPYVDTRRFVVDGQYAMVDRTPDWYVKNGYEFLVFSYGAFGRFFEDPERYPDFVAGYNEFFSRFSELARFNPQGYQIRVYATGTGSLPEARVGARLGTYAPILEFVGYDRSTARPGQILKTVLYWRRLGRTRNAIDLTVHLLDASDQDITRNAQRLFERIPANVEWPEEIVPVPWQVSVPLTTTAGLYRLQLDLDGEGLGRIPVKGADGQLASDKLYIGPFKILPLPPDETELELARQVEALFGSSVLLKRYSILTPVASGGDSLRLALYWQAAEKMNSDYTVFLHLVDRSGRLHAQVDKPPRSGAYPTSIWDPDQIIQDEYDLPLPKGIPPGEYSLEVGMYEYPSLKRLEVTNPQGNPLGDHLVLADRITVVSALNDSTAALEY